MTDTHDRHGYPLQGFFIAHKRFLTLPGQPWGEFMDCPEVDDEAVIEAVIDAFGDKEFGPHRDELRVWHIVPGKPAWDCTDWAVRTANETIQLRMEARGLA